MKTISQIPGVAGYIALKSAMTKQATLAKKARREARRSRFAQLRTEAFDINTGTCTVLVCLIFCSLLTTLIRVWEASL
jgi:hypothetical protein